MVRKTAVEDVAEYTITIATDLSSKAIELYNIFIYLLSFLHGQVVQLVFHIFNRIMQAEIGFQF